MDKIVGNYLILLFFVLVSGIASAAELRVYSQDGMPIKQAGVGQPFMLKCSITHDDRSMQEPQLEGTHDLHVQRTGFQMSTYNNTTKATYTYLVRAKKPGTYTIGPVRYIKDRKDHITNTVTVQVGDVQEIDTKQVNAQNKSNAFARLTVNKDRAYVGEKITYSARLYYQDQSTEVEQLVRPTITGFKIGNQKPSMMGSAEVNGKEYRFIEWSCDVYPTDVGTLTIDAHRFDFTHIKDSDDQMSRISMFFGPQVDRKRTYSNEVKVQVDPLPPYKGNVIGLGTFKALRASIDPGLAKEGDAMVLRLELEGDSNLEDIAIASVQGLPDCFRSYPSKQYVQSNTKREPVAKVFEFIVQGMKAGDWEIPPQSCVYFDVKSGQYKKICSSALSLRVLPATHAAESVVHHQAPASPIVVEQDELFPLATSWGAVQEERSIPFIWFVWLSLLPLLAIMAYALVARARKTWHHAQRKPQSRRAYFKHARSQLMQAQKAQDVTKIYPILVQLVAGVHHTSEAQVTQEYMNNLIDKDRWHTYVQQAAEYAFYAPHSDTSAFFMEGFAWLDQLDAVL